MGGANSFSIVLDFESKLTERHTNANPGVLCLGIAMDIGVAICSRYPLLKSALNAVPIRVTSGLSDMEAGEARSRQAI